MDYVPLDSSARPNFGAIEMDWDVTPVSLKLVLRDVNGDSVNNIKVLPELQTGGPYQSQAKAGGYKDHCSFEVDLPWLARHYLGLALAFGLFIHEMVSLSKQILVKLKRD